MLVRKVRVNESIVLTAPDGKPVRLKLHRVRSGQCVELLVDAPTYTVGVKPEPSGKDATCASTK